MPKQNNDLVCTRITASTKAQLQYIKSVMGMDATTKQHSKSDYAILEVIIDAIYTDILKTQKIGSSNTIKKV